MIKNPQLFGKELERLNEWWVTNRLELPVLLEREALKRAIAELESKRIIQIVGARRVGKTTLMKQLIHYLLKEVEPRNILYCSVDDPALTAQSDSLLKDCLDFFLEQIARKGKKYVFFDELHSFKGWYRWLKAFFDSYSEKGEIKFIISGSSSLTLQKEANLYLRGRTVDIELYPFSFQEFLCFKDIEIEKKKFNQIKKLNHIEVAKIERKVYNSFLEYLLVGGFPEWFAVKDVKSWFEKLMNDVPKKAVYEDVANLFAIKSPKILENIFAFILENQSRILSYEKINEVAGLHRSVLLNYIEYLKNSYLLLEIPKFAKSVKAQFKAKKKFLCIDQGLRNALLKDYELKIENLGFIVENVIGVWLALQGQTFYYRVNEEIDFVLKKDKQLIPIEVKYSTRPAVSRAMLKFMEKYRIKEGLLITKNLFKKERIKGKVLYLIPAWLALLTEL